MIKQIKYPNLGAYFFRTASLTYRFFVFGTFSRALGDIMSYNLVIKELWLGRIGL